MSVLKGEGKVPILFGSMSIAVGTTTLNGYLARPDLRGAWPTVIVVPSVWGVTSNVKDLTRRLARMGLAAVAADPFRGAAPSRSVPRDQAAAALEALGPQRPVRDLVNIAEFITNPAGFWSNAEHGFGTFAIGDGASRALAAGRVLSPAALAMAYPTRLDSTNEQLRSLAVPVLGVVGRADELVSMDDVAAARSAAPQSEWVVYDGAGHDFLDDSEPGYDFSTATDAIERIAGFFEKHLPPPN